MVFSLEIIVGAICFFGVNVFAYGGGNLDICLIYRSNMTNQRGYVPPAYIPLGQSDSVDPVASPNQVTEENPSRNGSNQMQIQWSSGICACCDDMPSCMLLPYPVILI